MKLKKIFFFFFLFITFVFSGRAIFAQSDDELRDLQRQIEEYARQIETLQSQANTLTNQIAQFDAKIRLTEVKIDQTQEQITLLGGRIDQLSGSLLSLTQAYESRVVETYKLARTHSLPSLMISSNSLNQVVSRLHYLKKIQESDQNLLSRLKSAREKYQEQKVDFEDLEKELEIQKVDLDKNKAAKSHLLAVTKNDEKRYQELLSKARAELEAIQAIIAGKGEETEVGRVNEGDRIASVIPSASTCSSGAHLHFEVVQDKANHNPANYLIPKEVIWDNAPDGSFGFSGSWQWPVNDPVRITQGYGMTYYASVLKYYGGAPHTGIDMINNNNDYTVKAVKTGTLYRGAIACGGGTLRYVHVKQDGNIDTYYLHINY